MYVDEYRDGHVEVTYITTHSGHDLGSCELPYLPLPISTKENVALKISQGIPPERIIDGIMVNVAYEIVNHSLCISVDIREGVGDRNKRSDFLQSVSRKHFITKQDIRNIQSKVNDPLIMRHKHDPTSVSMHASTQHKYILFYASRILLLALHILANWCPSVHTAHKVSLYVAELQQETFNPVLIYKPQGECTSSHPSLPSESFVLAIQTQFQLELYQKYASSLLCIDSTHGTNAYNFKLITCIVADEFGQGTYIVG